MVKYKSKYLGVFTTLDHAVDAYNKKAVDADGLNAVTNRPLATYLDRLSPEDQCTLRKQMSQHNWLHHQVWQM